MIEFNPDGSIKLPERHLKQQAENEQRMKTSQCITIEKDVVQDFSPKKCVLTVRLSDAFTNNAFVGNIYKWWNESAEVPSKIDQVDDRTFEVTVGTCFSRCSDCTKLVNNFRSHVDGNLILKKGNCPYEGPNRNFVYEDHFD